MIAKLTLAFSTCAAVLAAAAIQPGSPLQNTDWTLTHLQGKPVRLGEGRATPSLRLATNASRFSGSGGCNTFMGTYELRASSITFGPAASTRMTCPAMDLETRYVAALGRVKTWRMAGTALELLDVKRQAIARFEASGQREHRPAEGAAGFTDRVWSVAKSTAVARGTLYVFLSDGTLVVTSVKGKPSLGKWSFENGRLTMVEEGLPFRVDILDLREDEFRIRSQNPSGAVEITLVPAVQTARSTK